MLKSAASHAAHLVMEAVVGAVGLVAIAGCVLAWRLGQGPIDITALAQREIYRLPAAGAHVSVGHAELAWEGFSRSEQRAGYQVAQRRHRRCERRFAGAPGRRTRDAGGGPVAGGAAGAAHR
ncbi:MAG: hypothetical protein WDN04_17925 [Rhodospirillales bacterium]